MNYADAGVSLARADEAMVGVKKSVRSEPHSTRAFSATWATSEACSL